MDETKKNMDETLQLMTEESPAAAETEPATEDEPTLTLPETKATFAVCEIPKLRSENRKVFRMNDGTEKAIFYSEPLHAFNKATDTFEEVDNTLIEEEDGRHFRSGHNSFTARFSREETNDELFSIEKDEHRIVVSLRKNHKQQNRGVTPYKRVVERSDARPCDTLVFGEILADTDMEYSVNGNGVKEDIVIKQRADVYRYPFILTCQNLTAAHDEAAKTVRFTDPTTAEEVFAIPAPFMTDANGEVSAAVFYEMEAADNNTYRFTITADSDWINADERVFPVTIDPQIVTSNTPHISTYSWYNGIMSSSSTHIVGMTEESNTCYPNRMYMNFTLPTLPNNPRIKKAELTFTQKVYNTCKDPMKMALYPTTGTIIAGACTPSCSSAMLDYERMQDESDVTYTFDITAFIDQFNTDNPSYTGLVLKQIDETACKNHVTLYGSSSTIGKPTLAITYESSYGINSSYRTHTHNLGRFGQGSIDLQCGNLMFDAEDFAWSGNRMPVTIRHQYNSALSGYQYTSNSNIKLNAADFSALKLGYGWRLNVMQSMVECTFQHEDTIYNGYVFVDQNGNETYFQESSKTICNTDNNTTYNLYESIKGVVLIYDPQTRQITGDNTTRLFDIAGRLIRETDKYGNTVKITYTAGRITSILDGAGREFGFTYNTDGYLTAIVAPDETTVTYNYDYTNKLLTSVTFPGNKTVTLTYSDTKPTNVAITNTNGAPVYTVKYTFSNDRVSSVTEYDSTSVKGSTALYNYNIAARRTDVTTITAGYDNNNSETVTTVYTFNNNGIPISSYAYTADSGNVGIESEGSGIIPYASSDTSVVSNSNNLLLNHTFKGYTNWGCEDCNCEDFYCKNYLNESDTKFGRYALFMRSNNVACSENGLYQDTVSLPTGQYTFSVYTRVQETFRGENSPGIYIRVTTTSGTILAESDCLAQKDSNYIRLVAPFELTTSRTVRVHILMNGKGAVEINAPQLEKNAFANDYNLLQNGSFELIKSSSDTPSEWTLTQGGTTVTDTKFHMNRSLRLTGDLDQSCNAYQDVWSKTARTTREVFTLSGWAKSSNAIANRDRDGCGTPQFRLRALVKYSDTVSNQNNYEEYTADFVPYFNDWQFAAVQFAKEQFRPIEYIRIYCDYNYNFGTAFFDSIQLTRNRMKTDLLATDFRAKVNVTNETLQTDTAGESEIANKPAFEELLDKYGNVLTKTTFNDGEFGTVYRAFEYNTDANCMCGAGNDLSAQIDARGKKTAYTVNEDTSRREKETDRCGNYTCYEYDSVGRITKESKYTAPGKLMNSVSYEYDAFDNLTGVARGDEMGYNLTCNTFHQLESISLKNFLTPLVSCAYNNGNSHPKQVTFANGDRMQATYNSLGQMTAERWYDSEERLVAHYQYVYNGNGNIVRCIDMILRKEYNYFYEEGHQVRISESNISFDENNFIVARDLVNSILYVYDPSGSLIRKHIRSGNDHEQILYYDKDEHNNTVVKFVSGEQTISSHSKIDNFNRKVFDELQLGTGFVSRQFSYHAGKAATAHTENALLKSSPTSELVSQIMLSDGRTLSYEYDNEERITKVTDSLEGVWEYTYDSLGQLLTETHDNILINKMTYDNYGNILTKNDVQYQYDTVWKDKVTCFGDAGFTYDALGNPTKYMGANLTWETGRQLKSFGNHTYTYNPNGLRTSKTVNGVKHIYFLEGTKILREAWSTNTLITLYDNEDSICGIVYNNTPYYFLKNLKGDIIAITDKNGNTVVRYVYDAWGMCTITLDSSSNGIGSINPFRYRGYYYDAETGLYYLQSRYYDPAIGRFINTDYVGFFGDIWHCLDYNVFTYCLNNPINHDDYMGYGQTLNAVKECPEPVAKAIEHSGLQYTRNAIFKENKHRYVSSKYLGAGFTAYTFVFMGSRTHKWESTYIVGKKTRSAWDELLTEATRSQDNFQVFLSNLGEFLGADPLAPNWAAYGSMVCTILAEIFALDFSFEKYLKRMLGQDKVTVEYQGYYCGKYWKQTYYYIPIKVTSLSQSVVREYFFFGNTYWRTYETYITYGGEV